MKGPGHGAPPGKCHWKLLIGVDLFPPVECSLFPLCPHSQICFATSQFGTRVDISDRASVRTAHYMFN